MLPAKLTPPVVPPVADELARALADANLPSSSTAVADLLAALEARHWKLAYDMPATPLVVHPPDENGSTWLVCPFCHDTDGLRFQDSYCYERTVGRNADGLLLVVGFESTDDPGDDTPGLCCINCAIDVPLAVPEGWELDYR